GGAGLGLTIVQKLLLHCGGSITVKSRLGEGSTFNVLLPVYRTSEES
ncbi:MAG TPA: ATP-binding protein, partial [Leptolyngbya sp.]|nr:ATP-binding protein [Leptolyngbya sp.]